MKTVRDWEWWQVLQVWTCLGTVFCMLSPTALLTFIAPAGIAWTTCSVGIIANAFYGYAFIIYRFVLYGFLWSRLSDGCSPGWIYITPSFTTCSFAANGPFTSARRWSPSECFVFVITRRFISPFSTAWNLFVFIESWSCSTLCAFLISLVFVRILCLKSFRGNLG